MLLQTNSYVVPKEKRAEHARLMRRFRQTLMKLGCDQFEVYEQVGANWGGGETNGRFVQIMRFRDRKHQLAVQNAERSDPTAQALINEFCDLVNFPYQQQQGLFAVGFYNSVLPVAPVRFDPAKDGEADGTEEGEVPHDDHAAHDEVEEVEEAEETAEPGEEIEENDAEEPPDPEPAEAHPARAEPRVSAESFDDLEFGDGSGGEAA